MSAVRIRRLADVAAAPVDSTAPSTSTRDEPLPLAEIGGFALGSFGTGVFSTVPTILLLFYCTETLRLPAATAAGIVFLPKAWAIVWDPVVGAWSDRSRFALGRRVPFLALGTLGVAGAFAAVFHAPPDAGLRTIVWVSGSYFLLASFYSLFAVPYIAVPAELDVGSAQLERVVACRMVLAMVGVLAGASLAPYLVELGGGGATGYALMSILIGAGTAVGMAVATGTVLRWTRGRTVALPKSAAQPALSRVLRDRAFLRLAAAYLLQLTGVALVSAMTPYFVTQTLGLGGAYVAAAMGALLLVTICGIPLWAWVLRRMDGYRACAWAAAGYALACLPMWFLPTKESTPVIAAYALLGLPFAGLQLVPFVLLAQRTHAAADVAVRQEGLYTGLWTAAEKLGLALGPAAAGIGLAALGHVSGAASQALSVSTGSRTLIAFAPAAFLLGSLIVLPSRTTR